mmetsp:Transcript_114608/g.356949  ORF Transcript_114608/g.356949 Transcript_114608/m.356949 type:complete len:208 (-) Transcript_114608:193-816(-)
MSCESVVIDPWLAVIWSDKSFFRVSQLDLALSHSDCVDFCLSVNWVWRPSRVLMISFEWNLYPGLLGSTPPCKKASTAGRLLVTTRPSASASAKPSCTDSRRESSEAGFAPFRAVMALVRPLMAFARSAMAASNSAISFTQRVWASVRSEARSSCFFLRSDRSVIFVALDAVSAWMSALRLSMLSWPDTIESDFVFVVSLQKHAKVS